MNIKKIIHLIPCDEIGGVETGAKLAQEEFENDISYKIQYIYKSNDNIISRFINFIKTTHSLFKEIKSSENYIILSSTWMPHVIAFILNILLKNMRWISFLHNTKYTNIISHLICTKLTRLADKQVFDSYSSARSYNYNPINHNRIINYFFKKYDLQKFDIKNWSNRKYDFITVATNSKQKGYQDIEKFLTEISKVYPSRLRILIISDKLKNVVDFDLLKKQFNSICDIDYKLNIPNDDVLKCMIESKIYFCLSNYEGFAATIVESLLSGCFVVTTNVGEQKYYLHSDRKITLNNKDDYKLDFNYINQNGPSIENFEIAKNFLYQNINPYCDSLKRVINENK